MSINPINNNQKQINSSFSEKEMPQPLNESIFNEIDKDNNGEISTEEAKEYGFNAFEVKENLKKEQFLAKIKIFNQQLQSQSEQTQKSQIPAMFAEKLPCEMKNINGILMIKNMANYNDYYPLDKALKEHETDEMLYSLNLPDTVLKDINFSENPEILKLIKFSQTTFDKSCKFPPGYEPEKVMEAGKNPGLNVREMHNMGITGKGVNIAIIDSNLNPHENYNENIVHYEETNGAKGTPVHFHGSAVTSIAVGKETGVAPDAKVYYMATSAANMEQCEKQALTRIIELNKTLPADKKIRFVSISAPLYNKQSVELIKELQKQGTWVMTSDEFHKTFGYLEKKDPMGNPDDFSNYKRVQGGDNRPKLYINSGDRTVAVPTDDKSYRHDSKCSMSWSIPYIAGLYACACQVKPNITPQEFIEAAQKTAHKQQDTIMINAKEQILLSGQMKLLEQTAKELYPGIPFEQIDKDLEKQQKICDYIDNKYGDNTINIIRELAEPYRQQLLKEGKIDENDNYVPAQYNTQEINIIDAKALMEYLQKN